MNDQSELLGICGIGASAGGVEPIIDLIGNLGADTGLAVVVVQHLSPRHESLMIPLLQRRTSMAVAEISHGATIEPNRVYVLAPGDVAHLDGSTFVVERRPDDGAHPVPHPIDTLFLSLTAWGERSGAVVLSGGGDDGARGIEAVRASGGLALAQDDQATFPDMPAAAVATGSVDAVGDPSELADHMIRFFGRGQRPVVDAGVRSVESQILAELEAATGVNFEDYKRGTIRRRLEHHLLRVGAPSLEALAERVRASRDECSVVAQDLLVGVTSFFRDPRAFGQLADQALDELVAAALAERRPLRCWVAGCATGEEAYSAAMALVEATERVDDQMELKVFATDVHERSLTVARDGWYAENDLTGIDPERRERFFQPEQGGWRIRPEIRGLVAFSHHNLLADAPFTRIDLLLCRNTLIYFNPAAQHSALWAFGFALREGGVLMLGESESLGPAEADFLEIASPTRLFRKVGDDATSSLRRARPPLAVRPTPLPAARSTTNPSSTVGVTRRSPTADRAAAAAHDAVLAAAGISGLVLDESRRLVQILGAGHEWLRFHRDPQPSDTVRLIEDPVLRSGVDTILRQLGDGIERPELLVTVANGERRRRITLQGVRTMDGSSVNHLVFATTAGPAAPTEPLPLHDNAAGTGDDRLDLLETELDTVRNQLTQALTQQDESYADLAATNEELVVANEELQTSMEELSSVNEELRTVADQNEYRLNEVLELGADLEEILTSTQIGIVLLAPDLTIRRFSAPAANYFYVTRSDVGRPLDHVRTRIPIDGLSEAVAEVRAGGTAVSLRTEPTVEAPTTLLIDVRAYRIAHGESGVAITVVDITAAQQREHELRELNERLALANERMNEFVRVASHDLRSPLRAIRSFAEISLAAGPDGEASENLETIRAKADLMWQLLEDLLAYARSEDHQGVAREVNVRWLVQSIFMLLDVPDGIETSLRTEIMDEVIESTPFATCVRNLVDNAIRHHPGPTGQVVVTIDRVAGGEGAPADLLRVSISDDGAGVPATSSADDSDRRSNGALGIGLQTVSQILRARGSELHLHSLADAGTTVSFDWPLAPAAASPETVPARSA